MAEDELAQLVHQPGFSPDKVWRKPGQEVDALIPKQVTSTEACQCSKLLFICKLLHCCWPACRYGNGDMAMVYNSCRGLTTSQVKITHLAHERIPESQQALAHCPSST